MVKQFCLRLALPVAVILTLAGPVFAACADCGTDEQFCPSPTEECRCISNKHICILEPVPGGPSSIDPGPGALAPFFAYINAGDVSLWQWAFGIGVAIAVLNGTIGGLQIAMSNGDSGKVDAGKTRFISSALGLVMLILAGVILEFLNPIGFSST